MALDIHALEISDCSRAAQIVAANDLWVSRYRYPPEKAESDLKASLGAGDLILGAYNTALIGFAWILPRGAFGGYPYLRLLAIAPEAHGQGAGAQLLEAAAARLKGVRQFFLLVSDFNERAQRFYRRQGFAQVGTIPDFALDGVAEQVWVKRLD